MNYMEEKWERAEAIATALIDAKASAWRLRWPNYCRACGGWGGASFQQGHPYGATTAYETLFDPCDAKDATVCHRCGYQGFDEDHNGPCFWCKHEDDDGIPEF